MPNSQNNNKFSSQSNGSNNGQGKTQGGIPEQHAEVGRQSHKNDDKK